MSARRLGHLPALDGVRGLAVAGVVAFHAGYLQGGFLGVDLFFVLSGFLITSLLLGEHEGTGTIGLGPFWIRRARRLLPALLALLAAVAVYARWFAAPVELDAIRRDGLATIAYGANWEQIIAGVSYWDAFKAPSPLEHTWSLAIEEQFYVVWPVLVLVVLALARGSRRALAATATVLAVASMAALVLLHHPGSDTSRAYFGSDARASSLLFGALAAMAFARRRGDAAAPSRAWALVAAVAVGGVAVAWVTATGTSDWVYRGGLPLTAVAAAVAIYAIAIGGAGRTLTAALSWPALRHLGLVSYGLYLWHWPVDVVLTPERAHVSGVALALLQAAVALAIAEASYHLLEMPIRRGALQGVAARALTPATIAVAAILLVVATTGAVDPSRSVATTAAPATSAPPPVATAKRVLLVGDSGAAHLGPGLAAAAAEQPASSPVQVVDLGEVGCGVLREGDGSVDGSGRLLRDPDDCHAWPDRWTAAAASFRPQVAVLLLAWPGMGDRDLGGTMRHPCDPVFDADYTAAVTLAIDTLSASGAQVLVATAPYAGILGSDNTRVDCLNDSYRAAVAARPTAHVLDLFGWVCPGGNCRASDGGTELRPDGIHFDGPSATIAGRFVLSEALRLRTSG